jgi:hypothetical protein
VFFTRGVNRQRQAKLLALELGEREQHVECQPPHRRGRVELLRGALASIPRPADLRRYTQDDVNAAINRYADPAMHCELLFAPHPQTDVEHAVVVVPSDLATPVMSRRDCE